MIENYLKISNTIYTYILNEITEDLLRRKLDYNFKDNLKLVDIKFSNDIIKNLGIKQKIIPDNLSLIEKQIISYSNLSETYLRNDGDINWEVIDRSLLLLWDVFQIEFLSSYLSKFQEISNNSLSEDYIEFLKTKCIFLLKIDLNNGEVRFIIRLNNKLNKDDLNNLKIHKYNNTYYNLEDYLNLLITDSLKDKTIHYKSILIENNSLKKYYKFKNYI